MKQIVTEKKTFGAKSDRLYLRIEVVTALWALAEAALGGVLHALHVPFTGLFVNSCAVLFMVMMATATDKKGTILRATLIVMIVKGMVSPHTPLTAFVAVGFQGLMGEILLRSKRYLLMTSVALGVITLLQSAVQKIVLLTLVYGNNLWDSIDVFVNFILGQLPFITVQVDPLRFSFWLIITYIGIHLLAGIVVGIIAAKIPGWIKQEISKEKRVYRLEEANHHLEIKSEKKKIKWVQKPSAVAIILLASIIVILSYLLPEISETQGLRAVVMILRSTSILFLWYSLVGPYFLKLSQKYFKSKQNKYAKEVQKTLNILIPLRYIIYKTWNDSQDFSGLKRIKNFIKMSLVTILSTEFHADENN
jgi:hypothetical protein